MSLQVFLHRSPGTAFRLNPRIGLRNPSPWTHPGALFYSTSPPAHDKAAIHSHNQLKKVALHGKNNKFDPNSVFILSVPITTQRSFIYCHHKTSLLSGKQLQRVPWLVKSEAKLVEYATKGWNKLVASDVSINKKIVHFITRLLGTIPYDESSLRSFPSKSTMVREIHENDNNSLPRAVMTADIQNEEIKVSQLKAIPVYHPQFQKPEAILTQMRHFQKASIPYHRKWALLCALGIPITLPMALVPVAPNVPGFYLAYRLYCHIQALRGAKNLGHLIDAKTPESGENAGADASSLVFQGIEDLDSPYLPLKEASTQEALVVNSESIDKIVEITELKEVREDLLRAYKQEEKRLSKKENPSGPDAS